MTKVLFDELLTGYATEMSTAELPVLAALQRETHLKEMQPIMLSGHFQGNLLQLISKMLRPEKILEIGTFTGYSAICLAQGLVPGGKLHTIEIDEERSELAEKYFEAAGCAASIIPHFGDATEILNELKEEWDLVFIDADKVNYERYFDQVFDTLKPGGLIIADNVLFEGKVLLPEYEQGKNERAMHQFNLKIKNDDRVEVLMLPLRDGISVIRKVKN